MSYFAPDYAVAPGETIQEWLDENSMTQAELADRIDLSKKTLNQIIKGIAPLSQDTALKLEAVTRIPARTWNALESQYRGDLARNDARAALERQLDFLDELPLPALRKSGVITSSARSPEVLQEVYSFFGVANTEAWRRLWESPAAAFRQSTAFAAKPGAVAAWLRLGELASKTVESKPFNKELLRQNIPAIRALATKSDPSEFLPQLEQLTRDAGVVVLFVPDVQGTRCSGATRWIDDRPVIQLSLRHKSDDQLWFTLLHEIAHVLLHGKRDAFITGDYASEELQHKESEANEFAADTLIPKRYQPELPLLVSLQQARDFAAKIETSPGVVVGRLQHTKIWAYSKGNGLKVKYEFAPAAD
ncbi:ImmA/IrrE family metallo-endopeptidase [Gryllotalpicola protaetiae]|uniref:ImmA/IrrE family metallo-endopeptidase n=1 Tax=Gryllotalpicola protaetiae TaxID=2419771 RepID=A0A387BZ58_9MICO|nr:ImmA/IrrE family metallo-endopeptidase [Gryllotalpicola protaetiae]AYG03611.1 ImmA/IrrE family metallo-endopeptidase [Gryllotalpicola protaetiae]